MICYRCDQPITEDDLPVMSDNPGTCPGLPGKPHEIFNEALAELAHDMLCDVFNPEGDACTVTIAYNRFNGTTQVAPNGTGEKVWVDTTTLTPGRDVVAAYDKRYPFGGYLVVSAGYWGYGPTIDEAKTNMRKAGGKLNRKFIVYAFDATTRFYWVGGNGSIQYYGNSPALIAK